MTIFICFKMNINTIEDLNKVAANIEKNIEYPEKTYLIQIVNGFLKLPTFLDHDEPGIYSSTVKWFQLYMNLQSSIDLKNDKKLIRQFQKSISAAITYLIGCLQYKKNDEPDYHYNLLDILATLLNNSQPELIKQKISNFGNGTISCLWKPINFVDDFNTQLLALKMYANILKMLDSEKQNEELKAIKWTNLKLFNDQMRKVIGKTHNVYAFENACRDLLNNFNMNLSNKCLIYSFYCNTAKIGKSVEFFKPQFFDKFWIDMNLSRCILSFRCRYKLNEESLKLKDFNATLTWKNIKMTDNILYFIIDYKNKICNLPDNISSKLTNVDTMDFFLPDVEVRRIMDNDRFNKILKRNQNEDIVKDWTAHPYLLKRSPTTPLGSKNSNTKTKQQNSLKSGAKRKFFNYGENEENVKFKKLNKTEAKKRTYLQRSGVRKPSNGKKAVCKVFPIVDLTNSPRELYDRKQESLEPNKHLTHILDVEPKSDEHTKAINAKQINAILNGVESICYNKALVYEHLQSEAVAQPGQSYRNYKSNHHLSSAKPTQTKIIMKNQTKLLPTVQHCNGTVLKQEKNEEKNQILEINTKKRKICSQDLFDDLKSNENCKSIKTRKENLAEPLDFIAVSPSPRKTHPQIQGDCEETVPNNSPTTYKTPLNSPDPSMPKTPMSTNKMYVSDINNTPTPTHTKTGKNHFLLKGLRTENEIQFGVSKCSPKKHENHNIDGCVIYNNRLSDASDSEDDGENCKQQITSAQSLRNPAQSDEHFFEKPGMENSTKLGHEEQALKSDVLMSHVYHQEPLIETISNHEKAIQNHQMIPYGQCETKRSETMNTIISSTKDVATINYVSVIACSKVLIMKHNHKDMNVIPRSIMRNNDLNETNNESESVSFKATAENKNKIEDIKKVLRIPFEINPNGNNLVEDHIEDSFETVNAECNGYQIWQGNELLSNNFSNIVAEYSDKINQIIDDLRDKCFTTYLDDVKTQVSGISENILNKAEENRKDLEHIQCNMEKLMLEIENQYHMYVKKNEDFKRYREILEKSLNNLANLNKGINNNMEYNDFKEKFYILENSLRQNVWKNHVNKVKQEMLQKFDKLSEI
uniref:Uncharacterized protein n=2 Tax=Stomoxys calcitrans TaxID=35570 RepID=A0A1I8P0N6_STOCA